jgi:hypothetical protein
LTRGYQFYGTSARREYGITVTLVNEETTERKSVHIAESPRVAARAVVEKIEGTPWKVDVVSTPQSIYTDMQGRRGGSLSTLPEHLFSVIGRRDVLSSRILALLRPERAQKPRGHAWKGKKMKHLFEDC